MNPITMALISGGLGLTQGLAGLIGGARNKAPKYSMPKEYEQNLSDAQMRAAGGLPSASKQLATEQMARGTAAGLTKLNDRNMVAAGVAGLAQGEADQANKLAAMDAQARMSGQRDVAAARLAIAGAKDKDFAIKQQDYLRKAQANAGLVNSGIQNIVGGMQNYGMMDLMKKYYGGDKLEKTMGEKYGMEEMDRMVPIDPMSMIPSQPAFNFLDMGVGEDRYNASKDPMGMMSMIRPLGFTANGGLLSQRAGNHPMSYSINPR